MGLCLQRLLRPQGSRPGGPAHQWCWLGAELRASGSLSAELCTREERSWNSSCTFCRFFLPHALHGMRNFPDQGWNLCPLKWKHGVRSTGPPVTSLEGSTWGLIRQRQPRIAVREGLQRQMEGQVGAVQEERPNKDV